MADRDLEIKQPEKKFADCDNDFRTGKYVVYGVPYDATVSHNHGAALAPKAIREETYNFETYLMDLDVDLEDIPMVDIGDLLVDNSEEGQKQMMSDTRSVSSFILEENKFPLMMGGEHSVSEGAIDGFMELYHSKGGIVVIVDAHLDFREDYLDNPHSHACVTRRLLERWGNDCVVVVGVRSGCRSEILDADRLGLRYVTSKQVRQEGIHWVVESWDGALSLRDRPVYLSIDIDGIDPAHAPGTGTPEPWGLTSLDVLELLEELKRNTIAMDVVEVSPEVERYITPGLAAKLMRQMIGLKEMVDKNPTWLEKV